MKTIKRLPRLDGKIGWVRTSPYHDRNSQTARFEKPKGLKSPYDYAIIGAGFTGISLAIELAKREPEASILLLDALRVGEGSSGRNAGFIIDVPHTLKLDQKALEKSSMIHRLNLFAIKRLEYYKNLGKIECGWQQAGKYLAAHEEKNEPRLRPFMTMLEKLNLPFEYIEGNRLNQRLGTSYYRSAVYTPDNILVNPAALIRGIATLLPENVHLFEETPVTEIEYNSPHTLYTRAGRFCARVMIQTNSGYIEELGKLKNTLVPCFTYASLTKPLPKSVKEHYFNAIKPWGITSAHPAGTTVRFTHDDRIFIRNKFDYEPKMRSSREFLKYARHMHTKSFKARFPFLGNPDFDYTWGGQVTLTRDLTPLFTKLDDNVYAIMSCNGVGVARGTYLGYYMADLLHNIESPELRFLMNEGKRKPIPIKPLTSIGANLRFFYEEYSAQGDI